MRARPEPEPCGVLGTLRVLEDLWGLAVLRCVFFGTHRFGAIEAELGIASNVLTNRLQSLVDAGILRREPYSTRPVRHEYLLTEKGAALGPVILALRTWGARYAELQAPLPALRHHECGGEVTAEPVCASCGAAVRVGEVGV